VSIIETGMYDLESSNQVLLLEDSPKLTLTSEFLLLVSVPADPCRSMSIVEVPSRVAS
jgi:hypothetical protein